MSQTHIPNPLRRLVRVRARDCCEYCLIPESVTFASHWIDHIVAEKHGGQTIAENLANSCVLCNQHKGTDLASIDPESGDLVRIFNPRSDQWQDHFRLNAGRIESLTATGRVTVRLLQLNRTDRVMEREQLVAAGLLVSLVRQS